MSRGVLTAVSGFSGSGKGTIMKELLKNYSGYALSVSCTTRSPRPGERHGVEESIPNIYKCIHFSYVIGFVDCLLW